MAGLNINTVRLSRMPAIVLGCNAGVGIILVQHRSSTTLEAALEKYVTSRKRDKNWFASFPWTAIDEEDRQRLQKEYASRDQPKNGRKNQRGTLGDIMCGLVAECELTKAPKWEANYLKINFSRPQMEIPASRRKSPIVSSGGPRKASDVVARRLAHLPASGHSNVAHPWRG